MTVQIDADTPGASRGGEHGSGSGRRADIQGLRAVAVGLVVAFHAGLPVSGGFIGVDMFFVISGFVISGMLLRQLQQTARLGFASFYSRRIRRLLPALALVVVVVAVSSVFLLSPFGPQQATAKTGIAASLFSANMQLGWAGGGGYFDLAVETNALLHTWSLSVEEQFYLVFPAFLLGAWRLAARFTARRSRRRTTAALVLVATAASFALSCYTSFFPGSRFGAQFAFYSPMTRAWEFGVGVLLALAAPALSRLTRRLAVTLGLVGPVLIAYGALTITASTPFPGLAALWPVIGTALLLTAGTATNRGITSLLAIRPAVWIGDVSYGWYLWHWPLIVFTAAMWPDNKWILVAVALASLAPTWLSYHYLENPIRFNDRLTGRRILPLIAICLATPITACLGLLLANQLEKHTDAVQPLSAAITPMHADADQHRTCRDPRVLEEHAGDCTWPVDQPLGTVVLVGDSNAGQFTEPVAAAANQLGYNLEVATDPACPFADLIRKAVGYDGNRCHRFVTQSVDALKREPPALVIIASESSAYVNNDDRLRDPDTGDIAGTPEAKAAMWEDGLASVLSQLADAGVPTLVIHTDPRLTPWTPRTCPALRIYMHSCGATIDRAEVERHQRAARDAENRAIARATGAAAAEFTDDLCTAESCRSDRDGLVLYRDADHLSVDGALTLTDRFRQLIVDHAAQP